MHLPGFTAEHSLTVLKVAYRGGAQAKGTPNSIVPASSCDSSCLHHCNFVPDCEDQCSFGDPDVPLQKQLRCLRSCNRHNQICAGRCCRQ